MQPQKIKIASFFFLLPVLFLAGLLVFLCSCSKKNAGMVTPVAAVDTNANTMQNSNTKKYLALGDSYTIGTSVTEGERYPVQTVALLKAQGIVMADADIIATNGWTTADLINGINSRQLTNNYDVVSLLIGVNNQYQGRSLDEYKEQFTTLLQRAVQLANGKADHVFVLSVPDYSVTPFAKGSNASQIASQIDIFNTANKTIADSYKVHYLNVTDESRKAASDPSLVASDGLHFSGKEYAVWAALLATQMRSSLQ